MILSWALCRLSPSKSTSDSSCDPGASSFSDSMGEDARLDASSMSSSCCPSHWLATGREGSGVTGRTSHQIRRIHTRPDYQWDPDHAETYGDLLTLCSGSDIWGSCSSRSSFGAHHELRGKYEVEWDFANMSQVLWKYTSMEYRKRQECTEYGSLESIEKTGNVDASNAVIPR